MGYRILGYLCCLIPFAYLFGCTATVVEKVREEHLYEIKYVVFYPYDHLDTVIAQSKTGFRFGYLKGANYIYNYDNNEDLHRSTAPYKIIYNKQIK